MNTKNIIWSVVGGIVGALLVMVIVNVTTSPKSFGSLANCSSGYTCYTFLDVLNNFAVDGTSLFTGLVTLSNDLVINGPRLDVNSSDTATSSINGGCFGSPATSTASGGHYVIGTSFISTSTFAGTVTRAYPVFWTPGGCPNL